MVVYIYHTAGEAKLEVKALIRLGSLYLKHDYHEKAGKVGEMALGIAYGLNDQEAMKIGKALVDSAKHAKVCEEIDVSVSRMQDYCNVPVNLIVDPGLQTRVQSKYIEVVKAK